MIDCLLSELARFTGADWEQDDDVTIVTIDRTDHGAEAPPKDDSRGESRWKALGAFSLASKAGNERVAMDRVAGEAAKYLSEHQLERLRTAVAEAVLNAIEHGNRGREELPVNVEILLSDRDLLVRIRDEGTESPIPENTAPNLEAKLAGGEPSRGWGLFLVRNMVDEVRVVSDDGHHVLEMVVHRQGG